MCKEGLSICIVVYLHDLPIASNYITSIHNTINKFLFFIFYFEIGENMNLNGASFMIMAV